MTVDINLAWNRVKKDLKDKHFISPLFLPDILEVDLAKWLAELKDKIETVCLPLWAQAEDKLKRMQAYKVSPNMQQKATKLLAYVELRRKELDVFNRMIDTGDQEKLIPELNGLRDEMNILAAEIRKL